ncbi:hypothetical protein [Mammaliicoccus vitulinus]|uniref:hypothetical protein n=1 Tax=Mammaliicoccus vitulinus TaxID=71237 RepID=UPI00248C9BCC|nr:hypothetical protein [Mammaliicoccus vitulinus]
MIDLWTSRRDTFIECEYWSQNEDEDIVNLNEIQYLKNPTGIFYAKESNAYLEDDSDINNTFLVQNNTVTLMTRDNISDLKRRDLVRYEGKMYMVTSISKVKNRNQMQYLRHNYSCTYYINLRG